MNSRYSPTERIGVNAVERIVIEELGWIFREQSIVDVGVDAIIEQCEDGNPTGKFIAVQIKSGKSNFHISDNRLTYYASHIHYNYWLNLSIPIILVAYLPEINQAYWQHISEINFQKSKSKWKLYIHKKSIFDKKSKINLVNLISTSNRQYTDHGQIEKNIEYNSLFDLMEDVNFISRSSKCIENINSIMREMTYNSNIFNEKIIEHRKNGLTIRNQQVQAAIRGLGEDLNLCAKRMENEIIIFSKLCSRGFRAYKYLILIGGELGIDKNLVNDSISTIVSIPYSIEKAIESTKYLRQVSSDLPGKYDTIKGAKKFLLEVLDLIIAEYSEAKNIIEYRIQPQI